MKKTLLIIANILLCISIIGVGYSTWYFNTSTIIGEGEVTNVYLSSSIGTISLQNLDEDEDYLIELCFESDRISFLNDEQVNYEITSSSSLEGYSSYYINFSLTINLLGENASLIGNALHIDEFSYENFTSSSTEYSVRYIGNWGTPVSVSSITSFPYTYEWKFSNLTLGYASKSSFTSRAGFKAFKEAVEDCRITYIFNATLDSYPSF